MKAPSPEIAIRKRVVGEFGVDLPETARILLDHVASSPRPRRSLGFTVDALPPTVNHMYAHKGGRRVLTRESLGFRDRVALAIGPQRLTWRPSGVVMALVFLGSPHWITKRHKLRDMDGDNRLKALFDAVEACTGVPDCTNWEFHCWKVARADVRTTVYLIELGDLIDYFP
jgi:Holliday junction resolvase RusA-like endonuclease